MAEAHQEREGERETDRGGAVLVDVSSDIKRRGEGSGLDVITQGSCCRQEGWGGVRGGCYREQAKPAVRQNNDFRLSLQSIVWP